MNRRAVGKRAKPIVSLGRAVERERPGVFVPVGEDLGQTETDGPGQPVHAERAADRDRADLLGGRNAWGHGHVDLRSSVGGQIASEYCD